MPPGVRLYQIQADKESGKKKRSGKFAFSFGFSYNTINLKIKKRVLKSPGLLKGYGDSRLLWLRLGAFALAVAQYPLLNIPLNLWPLHWVSWIPFIWAIQAQKGRGNILFAYLGGTLGNLFLFSWIAEFIPNFSNVPKPLAMLLVFLLCSYLSLQWVLMAVMIPRLKRRFPRLWIYLVPALVVTLEFLMPQIFPYMQGLSHFRVNPVFQLASITGVYGISYLLLFSNCALYRVLENRKGKRFPDRMPLLVLLVSIGLVLGYGLWRGHLYQQKAGDAPTLTVGLIQSNITPLQHRKMGFQKTHQLYLEMSREAVSRGADWIVWSEGEFKPALNSPVAREILERDCRELGRPILLGGFHMIYKEGRRLPSNSAIQVDPETGMGQRYDKRLLVPFGEYLPLEKELAFIYRRLRRRQYLYPGKDPVVQKLQDIPYAFLICYEAIFPSLVRDSVRAGAAMLVNITYDAWFGRTSAPYQHLLLATARSAENGLPLVRLGTTGISTVIDALGRCGEKSELFQRQVLLYPVKLVRLSSLYTRIGNLFSWICVLLALGGVVWMLAKPVSES